MIGTVEEGFAWFEAFTNLEKPLAVHREYRLDRMFALLEAFNRPHRAIPAIHVAGSKGKGSTVAFIQSILRCFGLRVGGYYSPHVSSYRERYVIHPAPDDDLILTLMRDIQRHVRNMMTAGEPSEPTTFELLTLLAFQLFRAVGSDWIVLETGLGGRLDATNVVTPAASVITPIELEHTEYLGSTIELIAAEKAGIIKPGVPVFLSHQKPEAHSVFVAAAKRAGAPVWDLAHEVEGLEYSDHHARFRLRATAERFDVPLKLIGAHQAANSALAAGVVRTLFPQMPAQVIEEGLAKGWIPGRMERIGTAPPFYLDGAHTPDSARVVVEAFARVSTSPRVLLFGASAGKNPSAMAAILAPYFDSVVITRAGSFKPGDPAVALEAFSALTAGCERIDDPRQAMERCRALATPRGSILVTGSFYTVGAVKPFAGGQPIDSRL